MMHEIIKNNVIISAQNYSSNSQESLWFCCFSSFVASLIISESKQQWSFQLLCLQRNAENHKMYKDILTNINADISKIYNEKIWDGESKMSRYNQGK